MTDRAPGRRRRGSARAAGRAGSTRPSAARPVGPAPGTPPEAADAPAEPAGSSVEPTAPPAWLGQVDRWFAPAGVVIVILAAVLRLFDLGITPMHHDEGVNGWFVTSLVRDGRWAYDPANYHGPTLFYLGLASEIVLGLTTEAMRLIPALFGIGTVALLLALRPFIGSLAALVAALLVAVSPGAVYVSRYFIHESLLAFFTLAIVVALLWYVRTERERYLHAAAAALAAQFATKETGIIHLGVLAIALVVAHYYVRFRTERAGERAAAPGAGKRRRRQSGEIRWGEDLRRLLPLERIVTAVLVFAAVYVPLFTSLGTNPEGLVDSLATFTVWTQTGAATQVQPIQQYLAWMARPEIHILVLGTIGGLIVAWRGRSVLEVFLGLWALGITMAYSIITYKTPWIALNMIVPLAIVGGIAVREIALSVRSTRLRWIGAAGAAVLIAAASWQAVDLSFNHYDDETYGYVTVHTTRDVYDLIDQTNAAAAKAGADKNGIVFVSGDYWPLPWYYRDNPKAGFFGTPVDTEEAVIVANVNQDPEVATRYGDRYVRLPDQYTLRPGVELSVWVRSDLVG